MSEDFHSSVEEPRMQRRFGRAALVTSLIAVAAAADIYLGGPVLAGFRLQLIGEANSKTSAQPHAPQLASADRELEDTSSQNRSLLTKRSLLDAHTGQEKTLKALGKTIKKLEWSPENAVTGSLADLPRDLTDLRLNGTNFINITGKVSDLPSKLQRLELTGGSYGRLSGSVKDLPSSLTHLSLSGYNQIKGDLADIAKACPDLVSLIWKPGAPITGPLKAFKDLKLTKLQFMGGNYLGITGSIADLPTTLTNISMPGSSKVTGSVKGLSTHLTWLDLHEAKLVTGTVADLPRSLTHLDMFANTGLTGKIKDLPTHLKHVDLSYNTNVDGKISDNQPALSSLTYLDLHSNTKITGAVQDLKTKFPNLLHLNLMDNAHITGTTNDFPENLTFLRMHESKPTGDVGDLPKTIQFLNMNKNTKLTGKMTDLPNSLIEGYLYEADLTTSGDAKAGRAHLCVLCLKKWNAKCNFKVQSDCS